MSDKLHAGGYGRTNSFGKRGEGRWLNSGENSHSQAKQQVLSSDLIAMYGAKDSTELTYQIPAGSSSAQQQLAIEYEASDLLIPLLL